MQIESSTTKLEAFPSALCRVDLDDGRILACNASSEAILGAARSLRALIGQARFDALVRSAESTDGWAEVEHATERGRLRLRMSGVVSDRTALVAMDALPPHTDREDLDALVDMVADLRWEWDLVAGRACHYGGGLRMPGLDPSGAPSTAAALFELVHPDDRSRVQRTAQDFLEGQQSIFRAEYRIRDEASDDADGDGEGWRWVLSRGRIVQRDAGGAPLRVAGLITDITSQRAREHEQALLEGQLRHVQKLDALGQLTGGIAHDFNNILASVLGYSELGAMLLRKQVGIAGEDGGKLTSYLGEIRAAADRGRELIAKMLMFSRGGPQGDTAERVAPLALIEDTVRMLRPMLPATLAVRLQIDAQLPPLAVDPTQLQQIMLNLIINARDAVGENGLVTIAANRPRLRRCVCASCAHPVELDPNHVAVTVSDDGPGIPRHLRDKVFDPFFTTKEAGRGSGLGLSVVHGIIHEHGGHVCLETSDDGTAITLVLPSAAAQAAPVATQARRQQAEGRGRKILIIDDEAPIARWMAAVLEECGFVTDVYDDPQRALRRFNLTPDYWDLVITDQAMPGLSGVELADELLAATPLLPVVICSGYSEFVESSNAGDFGFRGFLDKPVAGDDLLETVIRVLDQTPDDEDLAQSGWAN